MAEAEETVPDGEPRAGIDTDGFAALNEAVNADVSDPATAAGEEPEPAIREAEDESGEEAAPIQPAPRPRFAGIGRHWRLFARWHPIVFLGASLALAAYAWMVYPRSEARTIPPPDTFYHDGLDRLYRVINPDMPLIAATPADEALAARNAFMNLFVFHRQNLADHPSFINPHLLLAEANRVLAEFNPDMAGKYWADAVHAYNDAGIWENREWSGEALNAYLEGNFLDRHAAAPIDPLSPEMTLRRERRRDYINYRKAEADVNLGHPELARIPLEGLRRAEDARRREETRLSTGREQGYGDTPRRLFELGPDEYRNLDLLLARTYDGLGRTEESRGWYVRHLASAPSGRNHAFVLERLADISMEDGDVFRRADPERAAGFFEAAADYYRELAATPSATPERYDNAVLGLARANSRLADLVPVGESRGVDRLGNAGRVLRGWLEDFSGQPLPRRTLELPAALGELLARPELALPGGNTLPGTAAGRLVAMSGGGFVTPYERRRRFLSEALDNYDRIASTRAGTPVGDRAAVMAAWESRRLGRARETEARLERMLDPLSNPEMLLVARLGLASVALERGDPRRAHMLVLGGYAHPSSLWFTPLDGDWRKIAVDLGIDANRTAPGVWRRIWDAIPAEGRELAGYAASGRRLDDGAVERFLRTLNTILRAPDLYRPEDFPPNNRNRFLEMLLERDPELLSPEDTIWRNRLLLEEALPYDLAQRASRNVVGFEPFPPAAELAEDELLNAERIRNHLAGLAAAWTTAADRHEDPADKIRFLANANAALLAALDKYRAEPGDILYSLAVNHEALADLRERQGRHTDALSLTAAGARYYYDVSLRDRGSLREMDALLAAGDAFFRSGLLERTVETQRRFLERFGHSARPGSDGAMSVAKAENLLGRAYWFLGDTAAALEAFRNNIPRRTPDRTKSIYYIGRVMMEEGMATDNPELLGSDAAPLPRLDRNGDPVIESALQAFNHLRQSPDINPEARAWRWATFDLAKLRFVMADRARRSAEADPEREEDPDNPRPRLPLYETARASLTEALERYPLRTNGGTGLSARVEPEDYADAMAARFEAEYLLAQTLLALADAGNDERLHALARGHLENLRDRNRYAAALFNTSLDRFQLNAAVIREAVEGGVWEAGRPLPRTRLGDDEGPTRSPRRQRDLLRNGMMLLGDEYFRAGERARAERPDTGNAGGRETATGYYQDSYRVWQDFYDRFGLPDGPQAVVKMGDNLNRLGFSEEAANHYRTGVNMAELQPPDTKPDGMLDIGPAFWGNIAAQRLRDMADGYTVP